MSENVSLKLTKSWDETREKIKESEMSLTDEDLRYSPGEEQQLLERLAGKLHKTPDAVKGWIESISSNAAQAG